jgi:hypothetical protein
MGKNTLECSSRTIISDDLSKTLIGRGNHENLGWWIEIFTAQPACIYYFGGYENAKTAQEALPGFTQDLLEEGASGLVSRIGFHSPYQLTVELETKSSSRMTHFPPGVDIL